MGRGSGEDEEAVDRSIQDELLCAQRAEVAFKQRCAAVEGALRGNLGLFKGLERCEQQVVDLRNQLRAAVDDAFAAAGAFASHDGSMEMVVFECVLAGSMGRMCVPLKNLHSALQLLDPAYSPEVLPAAAASSGSQGGSSFRTGEGESNGSSRVVCLALLASQIRLPSRLLM